MWRKVLYLLPTTLLFACSEIYQPEVETLDSFLVVEGSITTKPGKNYVYLSMSRTYNEPPYFSTKEGAQVTITGDDGSVYTFQDARGGVYVLDLAEGNTPKVGSTYTLKVVTAEGDVYESVPQKIVSCPAIKNIRCSYDQESMLTENVYGEVLEITYDGINVIVETDGLMPNENYYTYSWNAWEEHYVILYQGITSYETFRHRRLNNKYSNIIHTANADEYYNNLLRNHNLFFIIKDDMTNYDPIYDPDSFTCLLNRFDGLIIYLQQKSLSADAFGFYHDVEQQLSAEGRLFDVVLPQLTGNMSCTSDPEKKVMGIFYASDITEKIAYLYINGRNQTSSRHLDSLPELWLDTCAWSKPESWISPPF